MSANGTKNYWQRLQQSRVNRRRVLAGGVTTLTGGIALGLVGCGSSNNNQNTTKSAATTAATQAAAAAGGSATSAAVAPPPAGTAAAIPAASATSVAASAASPIANLKTGGTIQTVVTGTANLDPVANTTYRSEWLAGYHYARLFKFKAAPDPKVTLARTPDPDLVESYERTPDGLTYTMKLRKGVNYHPPLSRALTSADVLASYQYFTTNTANANKGVYGAIVDSLTAPDDSTLVWKLKLPFAPFLNKLANAQYMWILSKDAVDGKIDPATQPIGVGPWIFVNSSPTAFTWKKNPDYYVKGIPYADGAVLNIIPDTSTSEAQYQAGKIDIL